MKQILCISKNKDTIEKILEIVFWLAVIILITSSILLKPLNDLDEMWNYNFSKNILEGRLPYKDFNIIIMPLVPYIGTVFLAIFGNEMFSMRIFAIVTNFLILFSAEKQRAIRPERKNIMRINLLSNPKTKYLENKTLYITRAVITKTEPGPIPFSLVITLDVPRYGLISDSLCLSTDRDWRVFREILQQTGLTRVHKEGKD